jgi:hypothetical protein
MKSAVRTLGIVVAVMAAAFGYVHLAERKGYALQPGGGPGPARPRWRGDRLAAQRGRSWSQLRRPCPPCVPRCPSRRLHRALSGRARSSPSPADEDETEVRHFVEAC